MTQLVIYSQQLVRNNKFALLSTYQWDTTGTWVKSAGLISKSAGAGTLTQTGVFTIGFEYELKYTISGSPASGSVVVSDGVNNLHTGISDGTYTVVFTADGTDLIFTANSTFLADISNVSITTTPSQFILDIGDETNIPFKFSIEDIFEVGKRKAPRTGSFLIKGTHEVNKAFKHIYMINANSIFNPNIKTKCTLISDRIPFFRGILCLDDVIESIDSNQGLTNIDYNVSITESVVDIYSTLGEKTVSDLDYSAYNHDFNIDRVTKSWLGIITKDGSNDNNTITNNTFTVASQASVTVGGLNRVEITFTANHNFVVGQEVYVNPDFGQCDISGGASYLFDQVIYSIPAADKIVLVCSDPCAVYPAAATPNIATVSDRMLAGYGYYYPCADNGTYLKNVYSVSAGGTGLLEVGQSYVIKYWDGTDDFTNIGAVTNVNGEVFTATGTTPTTWVSSLVSKLRDTSLVLGTDPLNSKFGSSFSNVSTNDSVFEIYDFIPYLFVREILLKCFALADLDYDCELFDSKIFRSLIIPMNDPSTLLEDATVQMNDWTPSIKLKDILNSVLNMFNLSMIQTGSVLTFKNRGEYFDNTPVNWTDKVDIGTPIKLTMLNKGGAKIYNFHYSNSSDYINKLFDKTYGDIKNTSGLINIVDRNYGDYLIELNSDYNTDTKDISVIFEPSILAGGSHEFIDGIYGESMALLPMNFSADDTLANMKRVYSPKILIAGTRWNYKKSSSNALPMDLNFVSINTPASDLKLSWYYGHASHIDNPYQVTPNYDLNFTTPLAVYFAEYLSCTKLFNYTTDLNNADWANNSLFLKYWSRHIDQITNTNSKKVTARVKLSLSDVYNLDFTKPVVIGNMKLKLTAVNNWFINSDGLCDAEFLITK